MRILEQENATLARAVPNGMVFIPGGTFRMGSDKHYAEEAPSHRVTDTRIVEKIEEEERK
jgi:formylglycine-generating enzyme required for sulfatase activity